MRRDVMDRLLVIVAYLLLVASIVYLVAHFDRRLDDAKDVQCTLAEAQLASSYLTLLVIEGVAASALTSPEAQQTIGAAVAASVEQQRMLTAQVVDVCGPIPVTVTTTTVAP